jgi:molybdopterin converting factor small subunit
MVTIRIPTPLRSYTGGQTEVQVQGKNVAEAMEALMVEYPNLRPHLYNAQGQLRPFVNLFVNEENIRDLGGIETPLNEQDKLMLIPSIAGGWE